MTELTSLTLARARDALRHREFSAAELTEAHLVAMEQARALWERLGLHPLTVTSP